MKIELPQFEVKEQVASQDYDCDMEECDIPIPDETVYVRVAQVFQKGTRDGKDSARRVWKFHPSCWSKGGTFGG